MKILSIRSASLLALLGASLTATAQTSFYGGDYDGNDAVITEVSDTYKRVFDDFTVGERTGVQQIFGNFVGEFLAEDESTKMYYEIRRNVSDENGGELLYSGLLDATTQYGGEVIDGGVTVFDEYFRVSANLGQDVILETGTYFLGLAIAPYTYLLTTSHENASGGYLDNDVSYFDSVNYGRPPFESLAQTGNQGATDFSMGLIGRPAPVPEPATMLALGAGVLTLVRRRKRAVRK